MKMPSMNRYKIEIIKNQQVSKTFFTFGRSVDDAKESLNVLSKALLSDSPDSNSVQYKITLDESDILKPKSIQ